MMLAELVIQHLLVSAWGLGAMYLVWGTDQQCPHIYPLLFGAMSASMFFASKELPFWFLPYFTAGHVRLTTYLLGIMVCVLFLHLIIEKYNLEPSATLRRRLN